VRFLNQVLSSIISPGFYRTIYEQKFGKTLKYLFLLVLITVLVSGGVRTAEYFRGIEIFTGQVQERLPDFRFAKGELDVKGNQPIEINSDRATIIIDTSGKTTSDILSQRQGDLILLTRDRAITRQGVKVQEVPFQQIPLEFNKGQLISLIPQLKYLVILFAIWFLVVWLVAKLLWALLLALVGLIIAATLKIKLSFGQIYNISAYALTLPVFLDIIRDVTYPLPYFGVLYWLVGIVYVYLAIKAVREDNGPDSEEEPGLKV